jgi:K+-sensing histidine kinase KdpD
MMTRYLTRDRIAILAALAAPMAAAAILLPFRASWSNTNVAMLLVVVVVGVAAIGNRVAGGLAAVSAAAWFDFFFTLPYYRFTIRGSADITTAVLLLMVGVAVSQLAARARRLQVIAITGLPGADPADRVAGPDRPVARCRCRSCQGAAHRAAGSGGLPL